jgi:hypothetical protein
VDPFRGHPDGNDRGRRSGIRPFPRRALAGGLAGAVRLVSAGRCLCRHPWV